MRFIQLQLRKLGEVKLGLFILTTGIVLGFLFARIFKGYYWNSMELINTDYLYKIRDTAIDYPVLLRYVLWNIYRSFVLFWIISATAIGIPYMALCILYGGFQCGFFLTVIFMRFNLKGILLIFGYTFPHYLIYIPIAFLCLRTGYWLCRSMYYDNKLGRKGKAEKIARHIILIILLALVLLIGALLETYVSSFLLKKILLLF